jgi:hypothetical protein
MGIREGGGILCLGHNEEMLSEHCQNIEWDRTWVKKLSRLEAIFGRAILIFSRPVLFLG